MPRRRCFRSAGQNIGNLRFEKSTPRLQHPNFIAQFKIVSALIGTCWSTRPTQKVCDSKLKLCANFCRLDASCTSCYDFCLPDYAVERRQKYEDGVGLTIRRLNCFRHYVGFAIGLPLMSNRFSILTLVDAMIATIIMAYLRLHACFQVPEWINGYSIESDEDGGHFGYPRRSADTQRDENNNWVDWKPISVVGRPDNTRRRENYRGDVDGGGVGGGGGGVIDELTGANSDLFAPVDSPRRRVHVD